jgi:hypothetical protein
VPAALDGEVSELMTLAMAPEPQNIAAGAFVDAPPTPWHEFTVVGEYDIPTPESGARCITAMSDGRLFFTQYDAGLIGEIIAG